MNTSTLQYVPRGTLRAEFFRVITAVLISSHDISMMKLLFNERSALEIGRSVGLTRQQARRALKIHGMFTTRFGTKDLEEWHDGSVTLDPATLETFLSEPAATRLASEILGVSEANILNHLKKT